MDYAKISSDKSIAGQIPRFFIDDMVVKACAMALKKKSTINTSWNK